jgi:hypothetical protein
MSPIRGWENQSGKTGKLARLFLAHMSLAKMTKSVASFEG